MVFHGYVASVYGDSFRAFVVTSKCADAIPLYRQAKQMGRLGIPISRTTLTDLLHLAARQLAPLSKRLLELVAASEVVQADETSFARRPGRPEGCPAGPRWVRGRAQNRQKLQRLPRVKYDVVGTDR